MLFSFVSNVYERSKDANNKNKDFIAKIYYLTIKTTPQHIYLSFYSIYFKKKNANDIIVLFEYIKNDIELIYTNGYQKHCYLVLSDFMINYKEQIFIIGIKTNI